MPDGGGAGDKPRTLWIGDLGYWMDETFLYNLFAATGTVTSVKIIRSKTTNVSEGYGFIEFTSHEAAAQILNTYNGCPIPGTDQIFRLNWAAFGVGKGSTEAADHSVFVGDLAPDVTDYVLQEHFRQYFPSVRSAKVITDPLTSRSKGYGFVRFGSEAERDRALGEMSGHFISNRPIRVSLATAKKSSSLQHGAGLGTGGGPAGMHGALGDLDPSNTTLFIGGLSAAVTEDQLRAIFQRFGEIVYVKIPAGKGCGFVQFMGRPNAEAAMLAMNGQMVGSTSIRISWGRSSANRHAPSLGVVAPSSYAQLPGGYPGAGAYGGYDPTGGLAGAYGSAPYGSSPADPYAAYYAQQAAAAAATVDPYAAYQLYGSPAAMAGQVAPVSSMPGGFPGGPLQMPSAGSIPGGSVGFSAGHLGMGGGALGGGPMGSGPMGSGPMGSGPMGGGPMGSGPLGGGGHMGGGGLGSGGMGGGGGGGAMMGSGQMHAGQLGSGQLGSGALSGSVGFTSGLPGGPGGGAGGGGGSAADDLSPLVHDMNALILQQQLPPQTQAPAQQPLQQQLQPAGSLGSSHVEARREDIDVPGQQPSEQQASPPPQQPESHTPQ